MANGLILADRLKTSTGYDKLTENGAITPPSKRRILRSTLSSYSKPYTARQQKAHKKEQAEDNNCTKENIHLSICDNSIQETSRCVSPTYPRNVSFARFLTVKRIRKIPQKYAKDVWYTGGEMQKFRMEVLNCKDLRFKVKLKSARCHNHMRRVLLAHRVHKRCSRSKGRSTHPKQKDLENLSNISMQSSMKPREIAINTATLLEREIVDDQSVVNRRISSACFGFNHRWVFDYYLGLVIDNLCTPM
mmetsp:Transcript_10630/g.25178  ORF Transcript_10630/g.25178 Transcript_10630/m.25178 type:complete len:247 (-) Transcript_10630:8-748(-)